MASITQRGDRWQARVRRKGHPPQSQAFKTKAAAERWARAIEAALDAGRAGPSQEARRLTLADALDRYAREVTPRKRGHRRELLRIQAWQRHPLAQRALADVRGSDLAAYRDARLADGRSANTVRLDLALLSHLYATARRDWGLTGLHNPAADTTKPSLAGTARDRRLHPGELWLLWRTARRTGPAWLPAVIAFATRTAMRRSEISSLRDPMIQGNVARLPRTKNGSARAVPLPPGALASLRRARRAQGGRLALPTPEAIGKSFSAAARAAGIDNLHFHDLRHEATSRLFERGLSIPEVAAITGHRTWAMLARYTHPRAEDLAAKLAKKTPRPAGGEHSQGGEVKEKPA